MEADGALAPGRRPWRFGELRRLVVGISEKMLIQQLRELQADGVVSRRDFGEIPPRVAYSLTSFGGTLLEALGPLCAWGAEHMGRIEEARRGAGPAAVASAAPPGPSGPCGLQ